MEAVSDSSDISVRGDAGGGDAGRIRTRLGDSLEGGERTDTTRAGVTSLDLMETLRGLTVWRNDGGSGVGRGRGL